MNDVTYRRLSRAMDAAIVVAMVLFVASQVYYFGKMLLLVEDAVIRDARAQE